MIFVKGNKIFLRTFTREEYHRFWRSYVADYIMDSNTYVYDKERVDKNYDSITEKESCYPRVGIFLLDETPIGELAFKRINHETSQCELGIVLANDNYKGLGYGTEAVKLAIDYVFSVLKLENIYADTMGSNLRMQKTFNRFGFKLVGIQENFYDMCDRREDKLSYVLTNADILSK